MINEYGACSELHFYGIHPYTNMISLKSLHCATQVPLPVSQPPVHSEHPPSSTTPPAPTHVTTMPLPSRPVTSRKQIASLAHLPLLDVHIYPTGHGTTPHTDSTITTITGLIDHSLVITSITSRDDIAI